MIGEIKNKKYEEPLKIAVMALANVACQILQALDLYMKEQDKKVFEHLSNKDFCVYNTLIFAASTNLSAIARYYTDETAKLAKNYANQLLNAKEIDEVNALCAEIDKKFFNQKF